MSACSYFLAGRMRVVREELRRDGEKERTARTHRS
jgi:hypothetical protein